MRFPADLVMLDAAALKQHVELQRHQREIKRCLLQFDVAGIRKVWKETAPHLDQPESDWQALRIIHMARVRMESLSPQQKRYSQAWLREHDINSKIVAAVGIAVKPRSSDDRTRASDVTAAMSDAVLQAVKDGVDLDLEVPEVRKRMSDARQKLLRFSRRQ
jgi:hypothetical protein